MSSILGITVDFHVVLVCKNVFFCYLSLSQCVHARSNFTGDILHEV